MYFFIVCSGNHFLDSLIAKSANAFLSVGIFNRIKSKINLILFQVLLYSLYTGRQKLCKSELNRLLFFI